MLTSALTKAQSHLAKYLPAAKVVWPFIYLILVTLAILLTFSTWAYDDPYITYRYAYNLAEKLGFVYNPGQAVLSVTSPLFTLLLAIGQKLGFEPHGLAIFIGALSIAAGALFIWQIAQILGSPLVGWVGLLFYPIFPLLLTTLSSETPLYLAICLATFSAYLQDRPLRSATLAGLVCLTRPDGLLVPIALIVHARLLKRPISWKSGVLFALVLTPWLLFAWYTFGSPIPQTLFAKQAQGTLSISQGFLDGFWILVKSYADQWQWQVKFGLALLGVVALLKQAKTWAFLIAWTSLYFISFTLLGVSAYFWYYAPLAPAFLILTGLGLQTLVQKLLIFSPKIGRFAPQAALMLIIILLITNFNSVLILRQHQDERLGIYQAAGTWLQENTPENSLTAALEIGILGYYAQRPIIDFAGLLQPAVAQHLVNAENYESAAFFVLKQFHPDYLVLHQGFFPDLERNLAKFGCAPVHILDGKDYNYSNKMLIFQCDQP